MNYISKALFLLFFISVSFVISAQDYVVTFEKDTIFGKIIDENNKYIRFQTEKDKEGVSSTTSMNKKYIISYRYNKRIFEGKYNEYEELQKRLEAEKNNAEVPFLENDENTDENDILENYLAENEGEVKKTVFRFTAGGGYIYRTNKFMHTGSSQLNKAYDDIRNGFGMEADFHVYPSFDERNSFNFGIALNFNYFRSSGKGNDIHLNGFTYERFEEVHRVIYVGPAFSIRHDYRKWLLSLSVGFGAAFFNAQVKDNFHPQKITSNMFGSNTSFEVSYKFSTNWNGGLKITLVGGNSKDFNYNGRGVTYNEPLGAHALMISGIIGFRSL